MTTVSDIETQAIIDMMIKDRKVRSKIATQSFRLFFGTYFAHYIRYEFADFHFEMFRIAEDDKNKTIVIMGARNSAKSAIMNTALSIWSVLGAPQKKFVIIASRTQQKAKQHFMNMRKELESNRLLKSDLGPLKTEESQWGSSIVLPKYDAQITFASAEQSLRGLRYKQYRPDLLVVDDIEDGDSVKTIEGRNDTYNWLTNDAIPAGDLQKLRVVLLGTLLHEDSVMMRFRQDIEANVRDGVFHSYPLMDAAGNILWKGKYPDLAAVEAERIRVGNDRAWNQEFLLKIVSDAERVIHPEWIHHGDCPEPIQANRYRGAFISVDPAFSKDKRAACTAVIVARVFGWGKDTKIYIMPYPLNERITQPEFIEKVKALSKQYGGGKKATIYVEAVGGQIGIVDTLKAEEYPAIGIRPVGDKQERLAMTAHHIKNGNVIFARRGNEEVVNQIVNFNSEHYKDLADALSMLVTEIMNSKVGYSPFPDPNRYARPQIGEDDDYAQYRPITAGLRKMQF
jgi:predicted phage terminase large subunit-like protein